MAEGQGRSSGQGVKLLYIRDYLHKHTNKEHPKSVKEIIKHLASKGISVERKTIYNDILRLQIDFNEPIEFDKKTRSYYIAQPEFSVCELQLLLDAVKAADFVSSEEVLAISRKIAGLTNIYDQKALVGSSPDDEAIVRPVSSELQKKVIIQQAIRDNRKISFRQYMYYPTDHNRVDNGKTLVESYDGKDIVVVSPKKVVTMNGKHTLICFRSDDGMKRIEDLYYKLEYIEDVKILSSERDCIDLPAPGNWFELMSDATSEVDVAVSNYLRTGQYDAGMDEESLTRCCLDRLKEELVDDMQNMMLCSMLNQKECLVKLRTRKEFAFLLLKRFGYNIVIVPEVGDYCTTTTRLRIDMDFFNWLISLRTDVEIVSPPDIRQSFRNYVRLATWHYEYADVEPKRLVEIALELQETQGCKISEDALSFLMKKYRVRKPKTRKNKG